MTAVSTHLWIGPGSCSHPIISYVAFLCSISLNSPLCRGSVPSSSPVWGQNPEGFSEELGRAGGIRPWFLSSSCGLVLRCPENSLWGQWLPKRGKDTLIHCRIVLLVNSSHKRFLVMCQGHDSQEKILSKLRFLVNGQCAPQTHSAWSPLFRGSSFLKTGVERAASAPGNTRRTAAAAISSHRG